MAICYLVACCSNCSLQSAAEVRAKLSRQHKPLSQGALFLFEKQLLLKLVLICRHASSLFEACRPQSLFHTSIAGTCRAPEALVEWGTLRQLHTTLNRCIGPHIVEFDVIIRKMLEVVRALPFSADDVHSTRNAHGTFADTLRELADKRQAAKLKTEKVRLRHSRVQQNRLAAGKNAAHYSHAQVLNFIV